MFRINTAGRTTFNLWYFMSSLVSSYVTLCTNYTVSVVSSGYQINSVVISKLLQCCQLNLVWRHTLMSKEVINFSLPQ